jgi:hypothetical protein
MRIKPRFSITFLIIAIGFISFGSLRATLAEQTQNQNEKSIKFLWAFGAIKKTEVGSVFQSIDRDTALKTGDKIKFFIRLDRQCFVYLIYRSSQNEITALFPHRFKAKDHEHRISHNYYIPIGNQWFELDDQIGQEKFYLLASTDRLNELETIINKYESADPSRQPVIADKIQLEIRKLRKKHLKLKSYAERPVNIIGELRGTDKAEKDGSYDVAKFAIEISADTLYSRAFTIDHR